MKRIVIEAVAPEEMRPQYREQNSLTGDWFTGENGDLIVRVCGGNGLEDHYAFLYALHETVEGYLCLARGISQEAVDAFDASYQGDGEPGDHPACPYRKEHRQSLLVEFLVADMLGIAGYGTME
jgi:hypothetical protein